MSARYLNLFLALAIGLGATACYGSVDPPADDDDDDDITPPPPPPPPIVPTPAIYKRGSLAPVYQLTPTENFGLYISGGVAMSNADFTAVNNGFVSAAEKMEQIQNQIATERGTAVTIVSNVDRLRAQGIPFRGNPSDVDFIDVEGVEKIVVPLGGDLMTPGNEIAIVTNGLVQRITVGIRPQRVALHVSGLAFVCNQFSNYISIVDLRTNQLLRNGAGPIEIPTEYNCTDIILVERNPVAQEEDDVDLYVANSWRSSVLKYSLRVTRDGLNDRPNDVIIVDPLPADRDPISKPAAEIVGVGKNPWRLALSEAEDAIYVSNSRGGELSRIKLSDKAVTRIVLNAPAIASVHVQDTVFVATTTRDRGLLSNDEDVIPPQVNAPPATFTGPDGESHEAHPGALFDRTRSYNFEDLRNGMLSVNFLLTGNPVYFTDANSSEPNFSNQQKILTSTIPVDVIRNRAGTTLYIAGSGSDSVQELDVNAGAFKLADEGTTFQTAERPFALALDEERGQLLVATWGGERLQIFDEEAGTLIEDIDLGYGTIDYPATNMETGEFLFYNTAWSNNGDKSCATCHVDELLTDGIGYANGATAPTSYHNVISNFNQFATGSFFWNGSFANGSYTTLALAAQTRTNCELILFGLIEGVSSDPNGRVGDPNNRVSNADDVNCRPEAVQENGLPANFDEVAQIIAEQKLLAADLIEAETGVTRDEVFRFVDFYSLSELRLPPNPLTYLKRANELDSISSQQIDQGQQLFASQGCATCHDPSSGTHPFTDGLNHGAGADWAQRFVDQYSQDARILDAIPGGIPQTMTDAIKASTPDREINVHLDPIDFFVPFCFDADRCLSFEDPLAVRGTQAETDRLNLLVVFNLGDPERGFVPGNLPGSPASNTPSLRGTWWKANYLRHGLARTLAESILRPGHPALVPGENGFAIDALGAIDVHGNTSTLSKAQVDALDLYVQTIE